MELVNLTPHEIRIRKPDGSELIVPPSGQVARVKMKETRAGHLDGIPIIQRTPDKVEGIPSPQPHVFYLVSSIVMEAAKRLDVLAPDTGPTAIRDENGRIVAVTRLVEYSI